MSKGLQKRDYLSIDEVVKYIFILSTSNRDIGLININSGNAHYLKTFVKRWIRYLNSNIELQVQISCYKSKY